MNKQVNFALIGAGNRGAGIFGQYAKDMPHRAKFTAVVEPDKAKRDFFASVHDIPESRRFAGYEDFFNAGLKEVEAVIISTLENERVKPIMHAMESSYHILVEKPLTTDASELIRLYDATKDYDNIIIVCHQMRLAPRPLMIKKLVDSGRYGDIVCIQHSENLSYQHMAHSFVRGFFNNSRLSPMLLAKSCHDMDFLSYLVGRRANRVASFGSLKYFKKENCPEGAPEFCLEGCRHYAACPYHVLKAYFENDTDPAYLRQMGVIRDKGHLRELLLENNFGRCVFRTDNDVVDNQTVQVEFENDVHVSFTMCGHNGIERRMTKISMTNGEIDSDGVGRDIKTCSFSPSFRESIVVDSRGTHGGGDRAIMDNMIDAIETGDRSVLLTPIQHSLEGHLLVFAAEESRKTGRIIDLREYESSVRKGVSGLSRS